MPRFLGRRVYAASARIRQSGEDPLRTSFEIAARFEEPATRAQVQVEEAELRDVGYAGGPFAIGPALTVRPTAVVLATGKYIGGGIIRDGRFLEVVFDLPVFSGGRVLKDQFIGDLTSEHVTGQHLAFRAGVRIDASLRPLGVDGRPAHPRLFAAGAVLSGYDAAYDKSGLGVAIFTGYLAGEIAARAQAPE